MCSGALSGCSSLGGLCRLDTTNPDHVSAGTSVLDIFLCVQGIPQEWSTLVSVQYQQSGARADAWKQCSLKMAPC